jgi:hypothetical protein
VGIERTHSPGVGPAATGVRWSWRPFEAPTTLRFTARPAKRTGTDAP